MLSTEDVVELSSSDDEKGPGDDKRKPSSSLSPSSPMLSQSVLNGHGNQENGTSSSCLSKHVKTNSQEKNLKNTAKVKKLKTSKIIEIDGEVTNEDTRQANKVKASKIRLYGFEHKDKDFTEQFVQLLELCLKYEFSDGMMRILNKSIIPFYKSADKSYIESQKFKRYLDYIINRITDLPQRKFSALKDLCDNLKSAKAEKKRVGLVTLENGVSDKRKRKKAQPGDKPKEPRIVDVVDLVHVGGGPVIDIDALATLDYRKRKLADTSEKPKKPRVVDVVDLDQVYETQIIDIDALPKPLLSGDVIVLDDEKENCSDNEGSPNNNVADKTETLTEQQQKVLNEIKSLEEKIKHHKDQIKLYDEMEVSDDTVLSPYIQCDVHQAAVVKLYKRICHLSGKSSVPRKSKKVKLKVKEGHPAGPAKKLEEWLKNMAEDGEDPPFPDFIDVVKCVSDAIIEERLSWTKERILSEARMLFTECGRALKKLRQKREYRDLVARVKDMDVDKDPADDDPALLKILEENRTIASKKEAAIIEEYAQMKTYNRAKPKKIVVLQEETITDNQKIIDNNNLQEASCSGDCRDTNNQFPYEIPVVNFVNIIKCLQPDISNTEEIDIKPEVVPKPIDPNIEIVCSDSEDYSSSESEASDFELDNVVSEKEASKNAGKSTSNSDFDKSIGISNVKTESVQLNNLIEVNTNRPNDPSLVITNVISESPLQTTPPDIGSKNAVKSISNSDAEKSIVFSNVITEKLNNSIGVDTNGPSEPSFVITNVISESTLQTTTRNIRYNTLDDVSTTSCKPILISTVVTNALSDSKFHIIPPVEKIIRDRATIIDNAPILQCDGTVDNILIANDVDSTIKRENEMTAVETSVEGISRYPEIVVNYNNVILKTEPGVSTVEETMKMLLEFDQKSSVEGISVRTTIFDFDEEPVVCIEISSSESESDSGDENCAEDDDNEENVDDENVNSDDNKNVNGDGEENVANYYIEDIKEQYCANDDLFEIKDNIVG